jgi:hypothetical protein
MRCSVRASAPELSRSFPIERLQPAEKWQLDEDKLTFIVCARADSDALEAGEVTPKDRRVSGLQMIGDVNIFLHGTPHTDDTGEDEFYAEVEVMIAGTSRRGFSQAVINSMIMIQTMNIAAKDVH